MRPSVVVEPEVFLQPSAGLNAVAVGLQVDLLVLHRPPQPLDKYVVLAPAPAVHADLHPVVLEYLPELAAGELAPLVASEHLRPSPAQRQERTLRVLQRVNAEVHLHSVG